MGRIPNELRHTIAANIRAARKKRFPGRGGSMKCAEAFSQFIGKRISPQQWSPWERGSRTPDEYRLQQMAEFFGITVEDLRRDTEPAIPDNCGHPEARSDDQPPPIRHVACLENEIIWQLQKIYTGLASDGRRLHVSLNLVLSEEKAS